MRLREKYCCTWEAELADKLEQQPYIVVSQPNVDTPAYEVKPESSMVHKTRTLHRHLLLPLLAIPGDGHSNATEGDIQSTEIIEQVADSPEDVSTDLGSNSTNLVSEQSVDGTGNAMNVQEVDQPAFIISQRRKSTLDTEIAEIPPRNRCQGNLAPGRS
ncbi:MAG: hypothetical protein AB2693_27235 [Candidatus Thiodiazotropha sp.]